MCNGVIFVKKQQKSARRKAFLCACNLIMFYRRLSPVESFCFFKFKRLCVRGACISYEYNRAVIFSFFPEKSVIALTRAIFLVRAQALSFPSYIKCRNNYGTHLYLYLRPLFSNFPHVLRNNFADDCTSGKPPALSRLRLYDRNCGIPKP